MTTYNEDIGAILGQLKPNQTIVHGTDNPLFIDVLIKLAKTYPNKEYYIPYMFGYGPYERTCMLAKMYAEFTFPDNILFHESFAAMINDCKQSANN